MKRILALAALVVIGLVAAPTAASASTTHFNVSQITIVGNTASVVVTHNVQYPVSVKLHVNLRPDGSPGGGPGTANKTVVVSPNDPSPITLSIDLPTAMPEEGLCYAQVDVRWKDGFRTWRGPIPGAECSSPSPSPTPSPSETTTSPTPTPTPTPTSSVPTTAPSPSVTPSTFVPPTKLAHTGGSGWAGAAALSLALLALGGLFLLLARRPRGAHQR